MGPFPETIPALLGLAERGVGRGDRVALLLGNQPDFLFAWFGANLLGAIAVPVNPAYKPPELARLFAHCAPRLAVVADDLRPLAASAEGAPPLVAPRDLASGRGAP